MRTTIYLILFFIVLNIISCTEDKKNVKWKCNFLNKLCCFTPKRLNPTQIINIQEESEESSDSQNNFSSNIDVLRNKLTSQVPQQHSISEVDFEDLQKEYEGDKNIKTKELLLERN